MRSRLPVLVSIVVFVGCSSDAPSGPAQRTLDSQALLFPPPPAFYWYYVQGLPIPAGFAHAEPRAINDAGTIVGTAYTSQLVRSPVRWSGGTVQILALPSGFSEGTASDVNASGIAVGSARTGTVWHPVKYGPNGGFLLASSGYSGGGANGVNDAGEVVGFVTSAGQTYAARWSATGVLTVYGATTGYMSDVNGSNDAAGFRRVGAIDQPTIWKANGAMQTLPSPGVAGGTAVDVADDGTAAIVGGWSAGWSAAPYGALNPAWVNGDVFAISNKRRLVGVQNATSPLTMLSTAATPTVLPLLAGSTSGYAYGVNTCGTVVGISIDASWIVQPVKWSRLVCDP
jgi:hypothetical protein